MGFPVGMQLATVAFGIPLTATGKDVVTKVSVKPTSTVIWAATGQPIPAFSDSFTAEGGQLGSFQVPFVDQSGFIDLAGNEVTDFAFQINASWEFANERPITWAKNLKPLVGQTGTIDLDLVPEGPVSIPVTAPTAAVLGFGGRTGFITLQESDLPERLSVGELSATYLDKVSGVTKQRVSDSRLVIPGAPFDAPAVHSTATVSEGDSSIATPGSVNKYFAASPTSPYMALTCGGGFAQNTGSPFGWSASHIPPTSGWGSRRNFRVSVGTDAAAIVFRITKGGSPPPIYRVRVDGMFVGSNLAITPSGSGGASRFIRVDFPTAARRHVELEVGGCDIEGVYVPQVGTVWGVPPRGPRTICVGDSYTESSGDYTNMDSWVTAFADTMGWRDVWNSGIGSTGWAKESAGGANNSFEDRVAATVNAYAPEVVFFLGGYNDRAVDTAPYTVTKAAVVAALSSVRAALPNALIIVGLNTAHSPVDGSVDTVYEPIQTAINASAAPYADILLDTASAGIFTGTGTTSAPTGAGNSDVYLDVTNHPMKAGQRYLGQRLAHMVIDELTAL